MPIASKKATAPSTAPSLTPAVEIDPYKGVVVNNKDMPVAGMRAYLDGMPWQVTYYRQLIGEHNDIREVDPSQDPAIQQYEKISDVVLRVESSLSTSYDSARAVTTVTGAAILPIIVPNVNDYIVADAGTREIGIYRITNIERRTFNRDSVYRIDYELSGYISDIPAIYEAIETRVVRNLVYSAERVASALPPILTEKNHSETIDLIKRYHEIVQYHSKRFVNMNHMALVLPGQDFSIYDTWLTNFIAQTIPLDDSPEYVKMKKISTNNERYLGQPNFFSMMTERDFSQVKYVHQKVKYVSRCRLRSPVWLKGPAYWDIDYFVYPLNGDTSTRLAADPIPVEADTFNLVVSKPSMEDVANILDNRGGVDKNTPIIYSVGFDDYYVLSGNFYNNTSTMSVLEILVRDYLKRETIDMDRLAEVVSKYRSWPPLEQFYYGPILMTLIKTGMKGFF